MQSKPKFKYVFKCSKCGKKFTSYRSSLAFCDACSKGKIKRQREVSKEGKYD